MFDKIWLNDEKDLLGDSAGTLLINSEPFGCVLSADTAFQISSICRSKGSSFGSLSNFGDFSSAGAAEKSSGASAGTNGGDVGGGDGGEDGITEEIDDGSVDSGAGPTTCTAAGFP